MQAEALSGPEQGCVQQPGDAERTGGEQGRVVRFVATDAHGAPYRAVGSDTRGELATAVAPGTAVGVVGCGCHVMMVAPA